LAKIVNTNEAAFKLAEMATEVDIDRTYLNTLAAETIRGDDITTRVS